MVEVRLEDECCMRSHIHTTGPGARWLRSAEGEQLQLFESILDRVSQLIRERLQALLRTAIVEAQGADAPEEHPDAIEETFRVGSHHHDDSRHDEKARDHPCQDLDHYA